MISCGRQPRHLLVILDSLVAEGCPQLALQLCRHWIDNKSIISIAILQPQPQDLLPEFSSIGSHIHCYALGAGLARYPRLVWQTFWLCRRLRPVAVLSFPLGWHAPIALGARLAGVPRVCAHVGNLPPVWTGNAFRKFKALVQLGRPVTHRLLCCSEYIRAATNRDFGLLPRETVTVYNACDLQAFQELQPGESVHQPSRLGMVARLEQHKDQPTLIRAAALLRDRGIPVEVWLIGEGSQRPALERLIGELDLEDWVRLLGMRRDIPALLAQLDLFVFAARPDEGFGIALAEAMAAGVPIVATDVGACREVLEHGRCGLLVTPQDPRALAEGIREVLADPEATRQRAAAARQRAFDHFSVEAMAAAYAHELGLQPGRGVPSRVS